MRRILVLASLLGLCGAAACFGADEKAKGEENWETRRYFTGSKDWDGKGDRGIDMVRSFTELGAVFPNGASLELDRKTGVMTAHNARENFTGLEKILFIYGNTSHLIQVRATLVEVRDEKLAASFREGAVTVANLERMPAEKVRIVDAISCMAQGGSEFVTQNMVKAAAGDVEIGQRLKTQLIVGNDGATCNLTLDWDRRCWMDDKEQGMHRQSISTSVCLRSGRTAVLPVAESKGTEAGRNVYPHFLLVTPRVLLVDGQPVHFWEKAQAEAAARIGFGEDHDVLSQTNAVPEPRVQPKVELPDRKVAKSDPTSFETRQYVCDGLLFTKMEALAARDPEAVANRSVIEECLRAHGIAFPIEAYARVKAGNGKETLVIHNMVENLEKFEADFSRDDWLKTRIKMDADLVEVSDPALVSRMREGLVPIAEIKKLSEDKARVVANLSVTQASDKHGEVSALVDGTTLRMNVWADVSWGKLIHWYAHWERVGHHQAAEGEKPVAYSQAATNAGTVGDGESVPVEIGADSRRVLGQEKTDDGRPIRMFLVLTPRIVEVKCR